jgi:hypothetical protein
MAAAGAASAGRAGSAQAAAAARAAAAAAAEAKAASRDAEEAAGGGASRTPMGTGAETVHELAAMRAAAAKADAAADAAAEAAAEADSAAREARAAATAAAAAAPVAASETTWESAWLHVGDLASDHDHHDDEADAGRGANDESSSVALPSEDAYIPCINLVVAHFTKAHWRELASALSFDEIDTDGTLLVLKHPFLIL